ncbi:SDR family oxidoreductase [Vibrio hepatarius]|uniref:Short-chain dehydrogenase n=1 Tax=Vibrio hepatarius TaxID=171383 RepID=A0A0M0I4Q0_9VIBR|nr:SDR family oxidoreductase [Vibrio hepatarius]KOO09301.1 short-chain dehydrogenase [Vibrio hepatarius]
MDLNGKYVLLTGASGGIGKALANSLAVQGAKLLLVARNGNKLSELIQSLPNSEEHQCLSADLATQDGLILLRNKAREYLQQNKKISVVINNAGTNQFRFLAQREPNSIKQEIELNLTTPILLTQSALTWLQRPGIILNIGSTFGSIGYPGYSTYCAAKSGLQRFSEAMDRELDGAGVRVLYLAPRATDTELNSDRVNQLNKTLGNHCDSPQVVADHVVTMLQKETSAKWIGWPEKLFARINQIFPSLVTSSIRKQQQTIHDFIQQAEK